jgi:WD40 repeat protein
LSAGFAPVGESRRLGAERQFYHGVAWSGNGRTLIVSSGNPGDVALWRISLGGNERLERLSPSGDEGRQPVVALQQDRLAFTRARWDENIWSLPISAQGAGEPEAPSA